MSSLTRHTDHSNSASTTEQRWHFGTERPAEPGVYGRLNAFSGNEHFSYWDGARWGLAGGTVGEAREWAGIASMAQVAPWSNAEAEVLFRALG